jgi:hypothetical protein
MDRGTLLVQSVWYEAALAIHRYQPGAAHTAAGV